MAVIFFTLSSDTTFSQESAMKYVKMDNNASRPVKKPDGTYEKKWHYYSTSSRRIEVEFLIWGYAPNRKTFKIILEPGVLTVVHTEAYSVHNRPVFKNCKPLSAIFISD